VVAVSLRYEAAKRFTRHVDLQRVLKYFLKRENRRVDPDFSDVQLLSYYFRVDKKFRTDKVEVRYDPFGDLENVLIYSLDGEYLGTGTRHEREGQDSENGPSAPPSPAAKVKHNYLDLLIQKQKQAIDRQASGIDFRAALAASERRWPFAEFARQLASYLGRSGGLSGFRADELEALQRVYQRLTLLDPALLETACAQAEHRSITEIVFLLQRLHDKRSP
jgi:hypothetical protein